MPRSVSRLATDRADARAWRIFGALVILDVVLTFIGVALDDGGPMPGAGQQEVVRQFVTMSLTAKVLGSYLEFLSGLAFLAAALLLTRLLRGTGQLSHWVASIAMACAVLYTALVSSALAVSVALAYEGHQGMAWQSLRLINDGTDFTYYASLAMRGAFLLCIGIAGVITRGIPQWLAWAGMVVGIVGLASPLGVKVDLQQYFFLAQLVWLLILAVIGLARRAPAPMHAQQADVVAA